MPERSMKFMSDQALYAVALLALTGSPAAAADINVFSSGAPSAVLKVLAVAFARDTGNRVEFTVGTPGDLQNKLAAGATPDLVVAPAPVIEKLEEAGTLKVGSRVDLARVGVGVAVREGAPKPDISSVDAVRTMLLAAKSIVHTSPDGSGFAGKAVARMIEQMGIANAVKPKLTIMQAIDGGVDLVAKGKAEVGMFNISEILPVQGVALVGPLPASVQSYIVFAAALHAGSRSPGPAQDFVKLVTDPATRAQWSAGGLESMSGS
jgi:molybdate transport system substrate-binding protein